MVLIGSGRRSIADRFVMLRRVTASVRNRVIFQVVTTLERNSIFHAGGGVLGGSPRFVDWKSYTYKGKIYATTRFKLLGEGEKYTGRVDFSEEDVQGSEE